MKTYIHSANNGAKYMRIVLAMLFVAIWDTARANSPVVIWQSYDSGNQTQGVLVREDFWQGRQGTLGVKKLGYITERPGVRRYYHSYVGEHRTDSGVLYRHIRVWAPIANLSGTWNGYVGGKNYPTTITQKGSKITASCPTCKPHWTKAEGTITGNKIKMTFLKYKSPKDIFLSMNGTIKDNGKTIEWANNTKWTK